MTSLTAQQRQFPIVKPKALRKGTNSLDLRTMAEGTVETIGLNWATVTNQNGLTISSSDWVNDFPDVVALGVQADTAITSQVLVTATSRGQATLRNSVTLSDGQLFINYIRITVVDFSRPDMYER